MERIDLLWDAWEDCLCKEDLRAEFDRSKAENKATEASRQAYIKILDETMLENEELQSGLDKICEHWGDDEHPISTDLIRKTATELRRLYYTYAAISLEAIAAYLDSQKPSEKPLFYKEPFDKEWHRQNHAGSGYSFEDCPICNPLKHLCNDGIWEYIPKSECQRCNPQKCEHKNRFRLNLTSRGGLYKTDQCQDCGEWLPAVSLTQCPECIWGQKKVQYERKCLDYPYTQFYFVYERCPRCRGGGVI